MIRTEQRPLMLAAAIVLAAGLVVACDAGRHRHDHGATSRHRFDDAERWAAVFDDPARDEWQKPEAVVEALEVGLGDRVADIGAGTGYFTVRLARAVGEEGRVFAVEIESSLIDHLKARAGEAGLSQVVPVLAEPHDPGLPAAGVDVVLICDTWHHIDHRVRYLDRLAAALAPGGRVAVVDFREGDLPVGPPEGHKLGRDHVVAEFEEAGWHLTDERDILPYQYFLVFAPPGPTSVPEPQGSEND